MPVIQNGLFSENNCVSAHFPTLQLQFKQHRREHFGLKRWQQGTHGKYIKAWMGQRGTETNSAPTLYQDIGTMKGSKCYGVWHRVKLRLWPSFSQHIVKNLRSQGALSSSWKGKISACHKDTSSPLESIQAANYCMLREPLANYPYMPILFLLFLKHCFLPRRPRTLRQTSGFIYKSVECDFLSFTFNRSLNRVIERYVSEQITEDMDCCNPASQSEFTSVHHKRQSLWVINTALLRERFPLPRDPQRQDKLSPSPPVTKQDVP